MVEARREREAAVEGHEAEGRLETDDPATGRWDPDRASRVGSERRLGEPGRESSRRATARAAGDTTWGERIRHGAEVRVLGGRSEGELVQVGLADVGVARCFEPPDRLRGLTRHVLREENRPVGGDEPGGVEEVLNSERDASTWSLRPGEEDTFELGHSLGAISTQMSAEILITLASGRRPGEPY